MRFLFLCIFAALSTSAFGFDSKPTSMTVKQMLEAGDHRELADEAFDAMFKEAQRQLWKNGFGDLAERLKFEWEGTYKGSLLRYGEVGDHQPLSDWVAVWYMLMEQVLGENVMEMSHLKDIWVLNFTIPVTFEPHADSVWCKEQLQAYPEDTCADEYRRHFAGTKYYGDDPYATAALHHGFSGVCTYWLVFAGCEAALWGTDFTLVCGLAGDGAEAVMEKWPAPKISVRIWLRNNP